MNFTFEELSTQAQAKALVSAKTISFKSDEWHHAINTARNIKLALIDLLQQADQDADIATLTQLMTTSSLEAFDAFKTIEMPASTRIAVELLNELAHDHTTIEDSISEIRAVLEERIVEYWKTEFESENALIDFMCAFDMVFTENGDIESHACEISVEGNYIIAWDVDGERQEKTIYSPLSILKTAKVLGTVFHWLDKADHDLNIDLVMTHAIAILEQKTIETGGINIQLLDVSENIKDSNMESSLNVTHILGDLVDCLSHSDNTDSFTDSELFNTLLNLDPITADFLAFAQNLYQNDDVCDHHGVEEYHPTLFAQKI